MCITLTSCLETPGNTCCSFGDGSSLLLPCWTHCFYQAVIIMVITQYYLAITSLFPAYYNSITIVLPSCKVGPFYVL